MQRARTIATQQMAQRGLINSSMAQGAGTAAMIDRALPIAQQDAATYNTVGSENMGARNRAAEFGAGATNQFVLQEDQQQFQGAESALDREQQSALQTEQQKFQAAQLKIQNDFNLQMQNLQEAGLDARQAREIASRDALAKLEMAGVQNRFDAEMALRDTQFNIEQANLDRRLALENENELAKIGLQLKASEAQIPANFAATISANAMNGVNAILADPNLNATEKKAAIDNVINYANSQIAWGSKFYGATIPKITAPTPV